MTYDSAGWLVSVSRFGTGVTVPIVEGYDYTPPHDSTDPSFCDTQGGDLSGSANASRAWGTWDTPRASTHAWRQSAPLALAEGLRSTGRRGIRVGILDPEGAPVTRRKHAAIFDAAGRAIGERKYTDALATWASERVTTYDVLGRPRTVVDHDGQTRTFTYDPSVGCGR